MLRPCTDLIILRIQKTTTKKLKIAFHCAVLFWFVCRDVLLSKAEKKSTEPPNVLSKIFVLAHKYDGVATKDEKFG